MIVDALILAGGRSSRLGHSAKQKLRIDGATLVERAVAAVRSAGARAVVVVGDERMDAVVTVREQPVFGGPVAAIAAGTAALGSDSDLVLVLACDMPSIASALSALVTAPDGDGWIARDGGRRQQLAFSSRPSALRRALGAVPEHRGASVRSLLEHLDLRDAVVPDGSTDDIDTWDDAVRFGIARPTPTGAPA